MDNLFKGLFDGNGYKILDIRGINDAPNFFEKIA